MEPSTVQQSNTNSTSASQHQVDHDSDEVNLAALNTSNSSLGDLASININMGLVANLTSSQSNSGVVSNPIANQNSEQGPSVEEELHLFANGDSTDQLAGTVGEKVVCSTANSPPQQTIVSVTSSIGSKSKKRKLDELGIEYISDSESSASNASSSSNSMPKEARKDAQINEADQASNMFLIAPNTTASNGPHTLHLSSPNGNIFSAIIYSNLLKKFLYYTS